MCGGSYSLLGISSGCGWTVDVNCNSGVCGICYNFPTWGYSSNILSNTQKEEHYDQVINPTQYVHITATTVLSNEYTTDLLIANTEAALPPYPGTFNGVCSAYRNLSSDERTYTIRRFKYKFTFSAATQPFVIHWVERFTPADNGPPTDTPQSEQIPIGATETSVHEVREPNSNGTVTIEDVYVDAATVEVETASIRDGEFVITVTSAGTGTLDLIFKRAGSNDQIVFKTFENQSPGRITVRLDEVMNVGATPLDGQDGIVFDRAAARWRAGEVDVTSADRNFDVPVEVLSQRRISNYISPTWGGNWGGGNPRKGVYPWDQFPGGLYNVHVRTHFLDAFDPRNAGLAMDGNTVIRPQVQPAQRGFPQYDFLDGTHHGYIEFPDRDQRNTASDSTVQFLRSTSVAVRQDADRLSYRTADQVYVPSFGIRTVDDRGDLDHNIDQIDIWIGQGDQALKDQAYRFGIQFRTCLKILNQ
jgi:stringent starvation protein B